MAEDKKVNKISATRLAMFDKPDGVRVAPVVPGGSAIKDTPENQKTASSPEKKTPQFVNKKPLPDNPIFHTPMVLVSTVGGKLTCNQETLSRLKEIQQPLNIVSIVGTLRTGKSFLLNKLAGHVSVANKGCFEIGHTTDAVTKGIWVMCRPHSFKENEVIVLLDTEGIDDPDKVDIEDDKNLFILATLLSNTLVYNTRGDFERSAIDKFKFLGRIKTSIKVSGSEEDDSILDFFFPNFILTLRDATLETKTKDDDAFLEKKLSLKADDGKYKKEELEEYNLPRKLIRRYFKKRKCFRFRKPIKSAMLKKMLTLDESELKKDFKQTLDQFRNYIFSCKPKLMKSGKAINGRMFCSLALHYIHSLSNGKPPCLTSAMVSMAAVENTYVSQRATDVYKAEMKRRIASFTPSEKGLVNYHRDSMRAALEVLKDGLIIDDEQIYEEQAMASFKDQFEKFKSVVKKDIEAKCLEVLGRIDRMKIQLKIKNRKYCTPTGYDDYMADIDSLIQQFKREAGYMGSVALSVLQSFLVEKASEEDKVYSMAQEALDGQEGPKRRNIKRLSMFREEDANILKEEDEVEDGIRADIEMLQRDGLQHIGEQYFKMLTSKIEEMDRVKNELGRNNSHYRKLYEETSHWKSIFENLTCSLSHYKRQLKPVPVQQDMQATRYEEPWNDEINLLWKKAIGKNESTDEDVPPGDVLETRHSPEGEDAKQTVTEETQKRGHIKRDKCNIL